MKKWLSDLRKNSILGLLGLQGIVVALVISLAGCGKYGPPLAPEVFSPVGVRYLQATPVSEGVVFRWQSPEKDRRGKDLKSLDGYQVQRKELTERGDIIADDEGYSVLAFLPDTHVELLEKRKKEARAAGKPARQVRIEEELKQFEYADKSPKPGKEYLYKIVPINQGGVEGQVLQYVQVFFRGETSEISLFDGDAEELPTGQGFGF